MPVLQFVNLRRTRADASTWDIPFRPGLNLLVGGQNTSKTTTLRIIDFCLGHPGNARDRFSQAIVAEYESFQLLIAIDGVEHVLTRRLNAPGQQRQVDVDGILRDSVGFNEWIARALGWGWPPVFVPRGIYSPVIANQNPLTFRAVYRHVYRRANSWTEWARGEYEYYRRGVVAFLLGIAREIYQGPQVEITQEELRLGELAQRRIELRATLNEAVERVTAGFREQGATTLDSIEQTIAEIDSQIRDTQSEREQLTSTLRDDPRYDAIQDERLSALHEELRQYSEQENDLVQALVEHQLLASTLAGDLQRIERARVATSVLNTVMVTACPQCHQPITRDSASADHCYVCHQHLGEDNRDRRLTLERTSLGGELAELEEAIREAQSDLATVRQAKEQRIAERTELTAKLDRERRELVTPLVRVFERLQRRLGQLEQRQSSLIQLTQLRQRVSTLEREQLQVGERLARLRAAAEVRVTDRGLIMERTSRLAGYMNLFVDNLPPDGRLGGSITVDPESLEFFVGRDRWEHVLGEERKVPFLLAYHYAYLRMSIDDDVPFPRLVILDNPFQQDVSDIVVENCLKQFSDLCSGRLDLQVIVIVGSQRVLPELRAARVEFPTEFNPEPDGGEGLEPDA